MRTQHRTLIDKKAFLLLLVALAAASLACSLVSGRSVAPSTSIPERTAAVQEVPATQMPVPEATPEADGEFDLSQAGLPPDFPVYTGAHGFSGIPGTMVTYTVDADVRAASAFYDEKMTANGWTGFSTGGADEGSCGGDCGPVPTRTPGPGPTATPEGWMQANEQMWTRGDEQVMIMYSANSGGGTDVSIVFTGE
ncbi:MAG: hypothetical protein NTU91_06695 [Chloroflexi bacterium]|nr:hypothetical protein [Chloroflexota bacterium]